MTLHEQIVDALDGFATDAALVKTKADALVIGQALRDISSLCDRLAESLPE